MPTYSAETWARTSSVRHTTGNRRKQEQKKKEGRMVEWGYGGIQSRGIANHKNIG